MAVSYDRTVGLFGKGGLLVPTQGNRLREGSGVAKQRIKTASSGDRGLDNSPLENGHVIDSTDIAVLAYQLWQARGCPVGSPEADWFQAEQQLRARLDEEATAQISEPILVRRSGA